MTTSNCERVAKSFSLVISICAECAEENEACTRELQSSLGTINRYDHLKWTFKKNVQYVGRFFPRTFERMSALNLEPHVAEKSRVDIPRCSRRRVWRTRIADSELWRQMKEKPGKENALRKMCGNLLINREQAQGEIFYLSVRLLKIIIVTAKRSDYLSSIYQNYTI